jgi:predicted dehydrogenase
LTLGVGIIGVGDVAQRDYLPELHRLGDRVNLVAACGLGADRVRVVAETWGCRWTTSVDEVVTAPDVQVVLNLTPGAAHAGITLAALHAGKHVYTEKPLAQSTSDIAAIAKEASRSAAVVVAAPSVLVFPQVRRLQSLLDEGLLGSIRSARGIVLGGVPPWPGFVSDPQPYYVEASGGPLLDLAVYPLHALTGLLGPATRVTALSARSRDDFLVEEGPFAGRLVRVEADDDWHLLLEFASGTLAHVHANFTIAATLAPELELQGEFGTAGISILDPSAPIRLIVDGDERTLPVAHARDSGPDHILGVEHLVDCVEREMRPVLSIEHAAHVLDVLFAAQRSARDGTTTAITSRFPFRRTMPATEGVNA